MVILKDYDAYEYLREIADGIEKKMYEARRLNARDADFILSAARDVLNGVLRYAVHHVDWHSKEVAEIMEGNE